MARYNKKLDAETVKKIYDLVAEGKTLGKAAKELGASASNVRYWVLNNEELFEYSTRAREFGCDAIADECIQIADDPEIEPANKRIMVDTRIRLIGKWSQRYGDKITVDSNKTVTHKYDLDSIGTDKLEQLESILADARRGSSGAGEAEPASVH